MNFLNREDEKCGLVSENRAVIDKITEFLKKNVKYVSKSAMIVALASVLMLAGCNEPGGNGGQGKDPAQQEQGQTPAPTEEAGQPEVKKDEYEVDAHPEVKELVSTYYNSYAAGDIDKLLSITQYLSDMEKSYVKMMDEHVESYSNVTCYTKEGLEEGSYMVSATFDMKFSGVEGGLPGMDFFYLRTDKDGKVYIDNRYSSFNRLLKEQETEAEVDALIEEFEGGEDVQKLRAEVQEKYEAAVAGDENLKKMDGTVSEAIKQWKESYKPEEEQKEDTEKEDTEKKETKKKKKSKKKKEEEKPAEDAEANAEEPAENQEQAPAEEPKADETPQEDTTTPEINYVPEGKVLTATNRYNVRKSMDESADLVGTTEEGDSITVILSYAEGWTKVEWNGLTGYIRTDLLLNN